MRPEESEWPRSQRDILRRSQKGKIMLRRIVCFSIVTVLFPTLVHAQCSVASLKWPLPGTFNPSNISLGFGNNWVKSCGGLVKKHTGIDYPQNVGTTVRAAASGWVRAAQLDPEDIGWVTIEHGCFTTVYWHINPSVVAGQWINEGDPMGSVGYSPNFSPHLHFGIRRLPYSNTSNRGSLPQTSCNNDPAFPENFQNPLTVTFH